MTNYTDADDVKLVVDDAEPISVNEATIGFEERDDGGFERYAVGREQFEWSMNIELSTEAVDKFYEVEARNRFRREARALFALIGLWEASGGDMSVERHIRRLLTARY
jgi:hypothetical protein